MIEILVPKGFGIRTTHRRVFHKGGKIISIDECPNLIHHEGEQFLLQALFSKEVNPVPASYYLGIDARTTVAAADDLTDLVSEPSAFGYARKQLNSDTSNFPVSSDANGYFIITAVKQFVASGGSWGTQRNTFLTTASTGTGGKLLITSPFSAPRLMDDGVAVDVSMKIEPRVAT